MCLFYEEGRGNIFSGGFAVEGATKVTIMVDVLLQIHAGMTEGDVATPKIKAPVTAFRGVRACSFAPDMRFESISPGELAA